MGETFTIDKSKITIIIVEDDIGLSKLISLKIDDLGYKHISAYDYDEAKTLITNTDSCFVLLDYSLGNRFSSELVNELLEQGKNFPFIVLTGYSETKLAVEFMKMGAYDFLIKTGSFLEDIEPVLIKSLQRFFIEQRNQELQESLAKSEKLLRLMVDNMCDVVCKHNTSGRYTYVSPSVTNIFGYEPSEILGKHPVNFIHPDDLSNFKSKFVAVVKENTSWNLEYRFLKKNGEYIWVETSGTSVINNENTLFEIQTVTRNIHERILTESKLKHSEKQFRAAFEFAAVGMSLRSLDGVMLVANNALCEMLGYEKYELEGRKFSEFTHPDDIHLTASFIEKKSKTLTYRVEKRYIHKNGSIVWASVSSNILTDENNKPLYFIAQIQNITEQKIAEELAKKDDARLESLLKIHEFTTNEITELLDFALDEIIKLTNSKIGYIYNYDEDKKQFILNSWSKDVMKECTVLEKQTVYDLDNTGLWGEAVRQGNPVIFNNFSVPDSLKKGCPEGHVHLSKFLTIPIYHENKIVAVVGVANKKEDYDEGDVRQLTLIMDSVWGIIIRKKTEFELADRLEMEQFIAEISSAFVTQASYKIDNALLLTLSKIGKLTNADRAFIYIANKSDPTVNNTHEWSREFAASRKAELQNLKISDFPWWAKKIYSGQIINVSHISEVPETAVNERAFFEKLKIKSQLFVPLIYANSIIGLIGVATQKTSIKWSNKDIDFIKTISTIVASALKNSETSEALMNSEKRYRKLVDNLPDIVLMHHNGEITYVNEAAINVLGYSKEEIIGKDFFKFVVEENTEVRKVLLGKYSGQELGLFELKVLGKYEEIICIVRTEIVKLEEKLLTLVVLSDITKRKELEKKVIRSIDKQSVLNSMLKLSLENISLDKLMENAFNMLISIPWLTFEKRGCIFLVNEEGNLEMKTQSNLSHAISQTCRIIPFGKCVCGKVAIQKQIVFENHTTDDNETNCDKKVPHGHYGVPIIYNENVLGIINIYLEFGHKESNEEKEFLIACSNTIAGLIVRKKSETELESTLGNLEYLVQLRTQQIYEKNIILLEEIEERKQIEEALSFSEEKFKTIVEQSVYGIYIGDPKGNFIEVNSKGCEMSGYSREELLTLNMNSFFTPEERAINPLRYDLLDQGETVITERTLTRKDGSTCFIEMSTRKMSDGTYQAIFRDITEKKKAEEEIKIALEKEQELNALKSRFISVVSHEFRTPLAGLLLSVELLEKYSDKWDIAKKKEQYRKIYNSIRYTNMLLDDVTLIGKDDLGKLECNPSEFNLTNLSYQAMEDAKAVSGKNEISIIADIAENMSNIYLDEFLVRHILSNLLTNALKYSLPGSPVKYVVKLENSCIYITVSDEGIGIPEEDLKDIYERFHRAQNVSNVKGTGLGLSIVKRSVELMLGEIRIESKVGTGTTVYIKLPEQLRVPE